MHTESHDEMQYEWKVKVFSERDATAEKCWWITRAASSLLAAETLIEVVACSVSHGKRSNRAKKDLRKQKNLTGKRFIDSECNCCNSR